MSANDNIKAPGTNCAQFSLEEICTATGGEMLLVPAGATPQSEIVGVCTDTRTLTPGALFVALKGENFDGHEYVEQAAQRGAVAALVESSAAATLEGGRIQGLAVITVPDTLLALGALAGAHRKRFAVPVVAVTGSYGKTTTRAMIAAALSARFNVLTAQGNFNNEIGVPQTLLQLDASHGVAVIEMGMRGSGQIEYLAQVAAPDIGVITNVGPQHIELLGSVDNIAAAKAEVLRCLPENGAAVLPADDEYLDFFTDQIEAAQIVTFGTNPSAEYGVNHVELSANGNVSCTVHNAKLETAHLKLPLPGEHNAQNAAAALAVAGVLGVPMTEAARALEAVVVPGARMRVVQNAERGLTIIDDCYNAGPTSMRAALETLRDFPQDSSKPGRRVAILGAMRELGSYSDAEHRGIGALAALCAQLVIGVSEETRVLLEEAEAVGAIPFQTHWCEDAAGAAALVENLVHEGDVILVKGSRSIGLETVVSALVATG